MNIKTASFQIVWMFVLSIVLAIPTIGLSQTNPLEQSRLFPPETFTKKLTEATISSLQWQLEQRKQLMNRYTKSRDSISEKISSYANEISQLKKSIPPELRFMDGSVRSQLIGKAMEQLLESKLELATLETSISILAAKLDENQNSKLDKLLQANLEMEVLKAAKRSSLAKLEFEKLSKLQSNGSLSEQQLMRAKASMEIAQIEHQSAQARSHIENEKMKVEAASVLTQKRLEIEPVKSKIATIEKFIEAFAAAADANSEIDQLTRESELWQLDLQMVAQKLFKISTEMTDLESLKELIEVRTNQQ